MRPIPIGRPLLLAAVLLTASTVLLGADQRGHSEQQLLVTALSDATTPATGLTAADFIVREDTLAREVIRVGPAPAPSHVMLLVDDSQASERSIQFLRSGLAAFIARMSAMKPAPQLALMTFGERPTMRADFAAKPDAVQAAAARLFAVPGSGSYLLQALMDACQNLGKRSPVNPVIVVFSAEAGPEFSTTRREPVAEALKGVHASLWPIVLQTAGRMDQTPEGLDRAAVLGDVVTRSGGVARTLLSNQSIEPAYEGVASLLASRYLVTYSRPDQLIPPALVEVESKRDGVRLVASRWVR
jgi:hypothetical protein